MEEYTNQEIDTEYLQMLPRDSLQTVLQWTLADLENWSSNDSVDDKVQGFTAMLLEAVRYQMKKQIDIIAHAVFKSDIVPINLHSSVLLFV